MEETKDNIEFTIKNKPTTFIFSIAFIVISVAVALLMVLLIIVCRIYERVNLIWFIEVIPAFSLGASVFGLYVFYKEEFSLKEGVFRYVKVFKKDIVIKVVTIGCVYMRPFGNITKIEFMNKKGEITATLIDDGTILRGGVFLNTLEKLQIEVKRNGYGDE